MKSIPQISDAEWHVMKVLWEGSPMTAMDVIKQLGDSQSWKPKTVKTLLRRLVDKKAIAFTVEGRTYRYHTLIKENECIRSETESFLKKVFDGSFNLLVKNFIKQESLSSDEILELKKILEDNEK
ncbi:MAG: BlaI/MecI/CopY family transcriptional regulator [Ruminiclostridium sp.]|nr:BlaI/MecI/CopY family transcriptional regulator [Ruminiclostridium sp.]